MAQDIVAKPGDVMSERLKGRVEFGTTVPTGQYKNVRLTFSQEFWLDEFTHEEVLPGLVARVKKSLEGLGREVSIEV